MKRPKMIIIVVNHPGVLATKRYVRYNKLSLNRHQNSVQKKLLSSFRHLRMRRDSLTDARVIISYSAHCC